MADEPLPTKRISELPQATSVTDDARFPISSPAGEAFSTESISFNKLKSEINGDIPDMIKKSESPPVASIAGKNGFVVGDFLDDGSYVAGLNESIQLTPSKLTVGKSTLDQTGIDTEKLSVTHFESDDFAVRVMGKNGFYFDIPLTAEKEQKRGLDIDIRNNRNLLLSQFRLSKINTSTQPLSTDICHIISFGQSLMSGSEAWGDLSRSIAPELNVKSFGNGPRGQQSAAGTSFTPLHNSDFNPLRSRTQAYAGYTINDDQIAGLERGNQALGENPGIAAVCYLRDQYIKMRGTDDRWFVYNDVSVPGKPIEDFIKGAAANFYNRVITLVTKAKSKADALGKTYSVPAVLWLQGEYNYSGAGTTDKDQYKSYLSTLWHDLCTDIMAITGQLYPPAFHLGQTGGRWTAGDDEISIGMAQFEFARENAASGVALAGTYYQVVNKESGHLSANGSRWLGAYFGKSLARSLIARHHYFGVEPISHTAYGDIVISDMYVNTPPLQFLQPRNGFTATDYADKGFMFKDDIGVMQATNVEIIADTVVKSVLPRVPVGDLHVIYADRSLHGGNGCLADSDDSRALDNYEYPEGTEKYPESEIDELLNRPYPLENWCVAFKMIAEKAGN